MREKQRLAQRLAQHSETSGQAALHNDRVATVEAEPRQERATGAARDAETARLTQTVR